MGSVGSSFATRMPRSGIREVMEIASRLPDVIHLEVGEPDFATPPHIAAAAAEAAARGHTGYAPNPGIDPLREALADRLTRRRGHRVSAERVVVTNGGTGALYSSLAALVAPGEEVLLPDPGWPNYVGMVTLLGARPVFYPLTGGLPDPGGIAALVSPRTRVLVLNSPSNPVGSVIREELMTALTDLADGRGLWVLSDEVYEDMAFDGVPASACAGQNVVTVHSFSKSYAMTGWRVGYAVAPARLAPTIAKIQEPLISCVNTPAQMAALAALEGPQDCVARMRESYRERRDKVIAIFEDTPARAHLPEGAFYVWVDVSASGLTGAEFARTLIAERRTAVVPGSAFGASGGSSIRISVATSADSLLEGARQIVEHCADHR